MSATRILALAGLFLCQCASGPRLDRAVELAPTDRVVVVYEQPRRKFAQTMLSATVEDPTEFYSSSWSDSYAKVLSQDGMQLLLDSLATTGFFTRASSATAADASAHLRVRINERDYAWSATPAMSRDDAQSFVNCVGAFQNVYNATTAFHVGRGDNSVLDEHRRIQERNARILRGEKQ